MLTLIHSEIKKYYFITVFKDIDKHWGAKGIRCWGFYSNLDDAKYIVENNVTDLWETIYDYAAIETYEEGISSYTGERIFYRYDWVNNKYIEIPEPDEVKHFAGFAFG